MTGQEAIEDIDLVIKDCEDGAQYVRDGEPIPWDVHSWLATVELLENVKKHIVRINKKNTDMDWELNPDRMGQ